MDAAPRDDCCQRGPWTSILELSEQLQFTFFVLLPGKWWFPIWSSENGVSVGWQGKTQGRSYSGAEICLTQVVTSQQSHLGNISQGGTEPSSNLRRRLKNWVIWDAISALLKFEDQGSLSSKNKQLDSHPLLQIFHTLDYFIWFMFCK